MQFWTLVLLDKRKNSQWYMQAEHISGCLEISSAHLRLSIFVCLGLSDCHFLLPGTGTAAADTFYTAVPLFLSTMIMIMSFHTGFKLSVYWND